MRNEFGAGRLDQPGQALTYVAHLVSPGHELPDNGERRVDVARCGAADHGDIFMRSHDVLSDCRKDGSDGAQETSEDGMAQWEPPDGGQAQRSRRVRSNASA
jgi:hypothetical protein